MKLFFTHALLAAALLSSTAFAAEVDQREANQQARIAQGVKSGQLTRGETAHLENRAAERAKVNGQQDRTSNAIYRDKHDGRTR